MTFTAVDTSIGTNVFNNSGTTNQHVWGADKGLTTSLEYTHVLGPMLYANGIALTAGEVATLYNAGL